MKPINIYIHIPFCKARCNYCHFFSTTGTSKFQPTYFQALEKEIDQYVSKLTDHQIQTIYIGGGTPSFVNPLSIKKILTLFSNKFNISKNPEISIETNPESITKKKADIWLEAGINRISIGVQAWQNELLKKMNRVYTIEEFLKKFEIIQKSGFKNINIDLIFGIPGQTMKDWFESVDQALNLPIQHISCYSLELDNDSNWGKLYKQKKLKKIDEELDREMYKYLVKNAKRAGFEHYEISNFAKKGFYSKHNTDFWKGQEYLGFGAGAYSYFQGRRFHNIENIHTYIDSFNQNSDCIVVDEVPSEKDKVFEYIMIRLRLLNEGLNLQEFYEKFGFEFKDKYNSKIKLLEKRKLISVTKDKVVLTTSGLDLLDHILTEFVENEE